MRLSPSGLKLFDACQGAFALKYLEKKPETDNHPAQVGRAVHRLIELVLSGKTLDKEVFEAESAVSQEALDIYQNFERSFLPDIHPDNRLAMEDLIEIQLGENTLAFKADYIEEIGGLLTITDWKTGFKFLTVEEMKLDHQVRAYAVGALHLYPEHTEGVFIIRNIRLGQSQYLEFTAEEAAAWEASLRLQMRLVAARVTAYENGEKEAFPFMPGASCIHCGYFSVCPAAQKALSTTKNASKSLYLPPKSAQGAVALAERLSLIERHWEDGKKALKAWVEAKGSVRTNGLVWGIFTSSGLTVDEGVVPDELKPRLDRYRSLDLKKSSKIWQDQELLEELKKCGALRPGSTRSSFEAKKDKEDEGVE